MYSFENHIRVMLEFRAMDAPVEISVPWNVLFYLDTHAERKIGSDGVTVYRRPELEAAKPTQPYVLSAPTVAVA